MVGAGGVLQRAAEKRETIGNMYMVVATRRWERGSCCSGLQRKEPKLNMQVFVRAGQYDYQPLVPLADLRLAETSDGSVLLAFLGRLSCWCPAGGS
jgi:hypothetical protein